MKKRKNITLIAGIGVLAVLVIGYAVLKNQTSKTEEENPSVAVVKVNSDEIVGFSIEDKDSSLSFTKEENSWYYESDREFPVDQDKISALLENFHELTATRVLDHAENLEELGLANPSHTITLKKTDESETKIYIGSTNEATNTAYVYVNEDTSNVYMVASAFPDSFQVKLYDLALGDTFPAITASTVTRYTLTKADAAFIIEKDGASNTGWSVTDWDGNVKSAGSSEVNTRFSSIAGFSYAAFVDYKPQDLSLYGLEQPQAVLTLDYEVKQETTVPKQLILLIGNTDESGNYYVKTDTSQGVYTIAGDGIRQLLEDSASSYLTMQVHNDSFADLTQLSITMGGNTYTLESNPVESTSDNKETVSGSENTQEEDTGTTQSENTNENELQYYLDDREIKAEEFQEFYSKISSLTAQSRLEVLPDDIQDAELTLTFYRKRGEELVVSYHPYDGSFYLAKDNAGNLYLVNKMNVKEIMNELDKLVSE